MTTKRLADADRLLIKIGFIGYPDALEWARGIGWSDEKISLLLEHLSKQGLIDIETDD